jgi:hypothetical protein
MRLIVDALPYETRVAMLEGLGRYDIIAGAYSDRSGGVCPMLAAHRCGGRTDFRAFARAWDRFTGADKRARRATERELRTLAAQLTASVWAEEEQRSALTRPDRPPLERRRAARVKAQAAWLIPFRDLDEYHRAVELALREIEGRELDLPAAAETPADEASLVGL